MIVSEKSHQSLSDYEKMFEVNKKKTKKKSIEKIKIQVFMIMLTRRAEMILNPMRFTGY